MKKSVEVQSSRVEDSKNKTIKEDIVATLVKFVRVAKLSQPSAIFEFFWFLFVFVPISPHVIVLILHNLVFCME